MLRMVVLLAAALMALPAQADDDAKAKALNAAGIFAALAVECQETIADDQIVTFAREDAYLTLAAGGHTAEDIDRIVGDIFQALEEKYERSNMPAALCRSMINNIVENRDNFRAALRASAE